MNYNKNSKMRFRLWQRRGFWAAVSSLVALCLVVSAVPSLAQSVVVDIAVVPASKTVYVNDTFTLEIWVYPNGQQVDSVDADLTFHPAYLEVVDIIGDPSGLEFENYSNWNNTNGTLTHSRGAGFAQTPPSTTFRLCSIEFKAKAVTPGTMLAFTTRTDAAFEGKSVLGTQLDGLVTVTGWQLFLPIVLKSTASAGKWPVSGLPAGLRAGGNLAVPTRKRRDHPGPKG